MPVKMICAGICAAMCADVSPHIFRVMRWVLRRCICYIFTHIKYFISHSLTCSLYRVSGLWPYAWMVNHTCSLAHIPSHWTRNVFLVRQTITKAYVFKIMCYADTTLRTDLSNMQESRDWYPAQQSACRYSIVRRWWDGGMVRGCLSPQMFRM